jgi:hypothetical protein
MVGYIRPPTKIKSVPQNFSADPQTKSNLNPLNYSEDDTYLY